jgi:glutamate formiminotransferase/formiminotetrahydrofolate cyclodeaminase
MGAVDVCPFVPISSGTEADCILASNIVSDHFKGSITIYKYGLIASNQDRASLSNLRKGQYEGLKSRLTGGEWTDESTRMPDSWSGVWGESEERFGALSIGVRPVLIAYNVNVDEPVPVASKAAGSIIRTSGRVITNSRGEKLRFNGMLSSVQGMGVPLPNHGICQVSMNLQDYRMTPMHHAFELIESICGDHGVSVKGSELVGLVPLQAILDSGAWYTDDEDADDDDLVQAAIMGLGLDTLDEFHPKDRIIEWAIERKLG